MMRYAVRMADDGKTLVLWCWMSLGGRPEWVAVGLVKTPVMRVAR